MWDGILFTLSVSIEERSIASLSALLVSVIFSLFNDRPGLGVTNWLGWPTAPGIVPWPDLIINSGTLSSLLGFYLIFKPWTFRFSLTSSVTYDMASPSTLKDEGFWLTKCSDL